MKHYLLSAVVAMCCCLPANFLPAQVSAGESVPIGDLVIMKNGRKFTGFKVDETDTKIIFMHRSSRLPLPKSNIKEIRESPSANKEEKNGDIEFMKEKFNKAIEAYHKSAKSITKEDDKKRVATKISMCREKIEIIFKARFRVDLDKLKDLMSQKLYDKAISHCRKILNDPDIDKYNANLIRREIADIHCNKAEERIDKLKRIQALNEINLAITETDWYHRPYVLLGEVLMLQDERTTTTAQAFIKALELAENKLTLKDRIDITLKIARLLRENNLLNNAVEYYNKAIDLGQDNEIVREELVETFIDIAKDYEEVDTESRVNYIKLLEKAIELDSEREATRLLLARIHIFSNEYDKGISQMQQIIELRPTARGNHLILGKAYYDRSKLHLSKSLEFLEKSENNKARIQLELEDENLREAVSALKIESSLDDSNFEAYLLLAEISLKQKQFAKAITFSYKTLDVAPDSFAPIPVIAEAYYREGPQNFAEARQWFTKILDQQPDNIDAMLRMAQMDMEDESFESATTSFEKIMTLLVEEVDDVTTDILAKLSRKQKDIVAECETNLGEIILITRQFPREARVKHDRALKYNPIFSKAYRNMGKCHIKQDAEGSWEEAEKAFLRARDIDESDPDNWLELGSLYEKLKNRDESIKNYKQYILKGGRDWAKVQETLLDLGLDVDELPKSPLENKKALSDIIPNKKGVTPKINDNDNKETTTEKPDEG